MSTRSEILDALSAAPSGLTSKELAPLCPAAECDDQIVGRNIAMLRAESVIHAVGLREGATIYVFGKGPAEHSFTVNERPLPRPEVSRAAHAIASMRTSKPAAERAPDRAPEPVTTPSPARPAASPEPSMNKKTLAERVVDALRAHGDQTLEQVAKRCGSTVASLYTTMGQLRGKGVVRLPRETGNTHAVYTLKDKKAPKADMPAAGAELGRRSPAKPTKQNPKKPLARVNGRAPGAAPAAKPITNGKGATFAINEYGEVGIHRGSELMKLDPSEFTRLREFIERTESVWKAPGA